LEAHLQLSEFIEYLRETQMLVRFLTTSQRRPMPNASLWSSNQIRNAALFGFIQRLLVEPRIGSVSIGVQRSALRSPVDYSDVIPQADLRFPAGFLVRAITV